MIKAYLAGDCFYEHDLLRTELWSKKILEAFPSMDLYAPMLNKEINSIEGKRKCADPKDIVKGDNDRLDEVDILFVCLDGNTLAPGSMLETGRVSYAIDHCGANKMIIGICTDTREMSWTWSKEKDDFAHNEICSCPYSYQNIYCAQIIKDCGGIFHSVDDAISYLKSIDVESRFNNYEGGDTK